MSYRLDQRMMNESYEDYLKRAEKHNPNKDNWIKDIISGKTETSNIIYHDDEFIMFPPGNKKDLSKFHMLAFVKDFNIRSMRDLNGSHIELLENILRKGLNAILEKFGINQSNLRIYVHYPPTSWILHVHFNIISDTSSSASVEYSNSLYNIIMNLKMNSDYYKQDMYVMM